jgi:polyhydroxyalkanoate synthesis repressor PhaR
VSEPRIIKKYPNRRLYDTTESRYITLEDIRKLVVRGVEFTVIDKKSQDDITRMILLQVIAEQEHAVEPLLSRDFLSLVIRAYDTPSRDVFGSYLEQSLKLFAQEPALPAEGELSQRNYQRWRSVQDEIYRTLQNATAKARSEAEESSPAGHSVA